MLFSLSGFSFLIFQQCYASYMIHFISSDTELGFSIDAVIL